MKTDQSLLLLENNKNLVKIIEDVLIQAKTAGATSAEASIGVGTGLLATARMGTVERLEYENDKALNITVYINGQKGSSSTSDFNKIAVENSVYAAFNIAKYAGQDNCAGLAAPELMAKENPDLDLYHPWLISPKAAIETAIECEKYALNQDKRITNSDGAVVSTYSGSSFYGNTHNFIKGWKWSSHSIDCTVIAEDKNGKQRDSWYSKARNYNELETVKSIGLKSSHRAVSRLGARKLSTRKAPVIFEASVAQSLFAAFIYAISGESLYRKASFLLNKKGEKIFPSYINIYENPHIKKALGSAPFDNDGVATKAHDIVKDGNLCDYILSAYSAKKLGLKTTGNAGGVHNLIVKTSDENLQSMIKTMNQGLFVTDMIGFGVNQVTGDYSRGASGFWVENGEIAYPVEEITIAGNLISMYKNIVSISNDVDRRGNILTGSVFINNMTIAGK